MDRRLEPAYTYVSMRIRECRAMDSFFNEKMMHLCLTTGATPKEGPSTGGYDPWPQLLNLSELIYRRHHAWQRS